MPLVASSCRVARMKPFGSAAWAGRGNSATGDDATAASSRSAASGWRPFRTRPMPRR